MPARWVQEHFKHILVDSAELWVTGKHKGAEMTWPKVVTATAKNIEIALLERKEPIPPNLEKV